ncbi:MAG: hypothetical protein IT462_09080 [Planctomycetes bacterium]|nr:hypothetical protein [Planctomycetota bacterium]
MTAVSRVASRLCRVMLLAALGLIAAARTPVDGQAASAPPLSFQLNEIRKAWLYDDDAGAEARLAAIEGDSRVSGELPRWYASLRAALCLKRGDAPAAMAILRASLKSAVQARDFARAARLLVTFGQLKEALEVVREGRLRGPDSMTLVRYEADLLWLSGDFEGALAAYRQAILNGPAGYPYQVQDSRSWDEVKAWQPAEPKKEVAAPAATGSAKTEPFSSLCVTPVWYITDLPGLERLLDEMAADARRAAKARANLDAAIKATTEARAAVDAFRGAIEERTKLEAKTRITLWDALLTARIVALADLAAGKPADAEAAARKALQLQGQDVALLDILARALAAQGKSAEARTGPLRDLRDNANLAVWNGMMLGAQTRLQDQVLNRIFTGALNLYRKDPKAGAAEFNELRLQFGPKGEGESVPVGCLGFWLASNGVNDLAREYLREASRLDGFEAGGLQSWDTLWVENALIGLDLADVAKGLEGGGSAPAAGQRKGLLGLAPRAGFVAANIFDRQRMRTAAGIHPFGYHRYNESAYYTLSARPDVLATFKTVVWALPEMIAASATPEELEEVLNVESAESKALKTTLDAITDLAGRIKQNPRDGNLGEQFNKKLLAVLGAVETRATVLRARLNQLKPVNLKEVADWLAKNQGQLDLRPVIWAERLADTGDDAARRLADSRLAAGIPEVIHSGVLMDCARCLARAGQYSDAAKLLLYNPVPPFGAESSVRVISFAAVLAQKGKDDTLAARCWMKAASPMVQSQWEAAPVAEYAFARKDIIEFGNAADLATYVENQYVPYVAGAGLDEIFAMSPELKDVNPALLMRNPAHEGLAGIFGSFLQTSNTGAIPDNWPKLLRAPEMHGNCWRLAVFVIASDLPTARTGYDDFEDLESRQAFFPRGYRPQYNGLNSTDDYMLGLRLLATLNEMRPKDAVARADALYLRTTIKRCMARQSN